MEPTIIETVEQTYGKEIQMPTSDSYNTLFKKIKDCDLAKDPTNFPSINEYLQVIQYMNNEKLNNNK